MLERRASNVIESVGRPSNMTRPSVGMQRNRARVRVDLPDPVRPTARSVNVRHAETGNAGLPMPTRSPALAVKEIPCKIVGPS